MTRKKILIINPYMHVGGVEKSLLSLMNELINKEYDLSLLLVEPEGELIDLIPKEVTLVSCPFRREMQSCKDKSAKGIINYLISERRFLYLIRYVISYVIMVALKRDSLFANTVFTKSVDFYDIIFNFCGPNNYTSALSEVIYKCDKRFIWIHNEFKEANKSAVNYRYRYEHYDRIFAVSKSCKEEFMSLVPELKNKVTVLYNITNSDFYHRLASDHESFDDGYLGCRILSVGRLNAQKGFDIAIQVAYKMKIKGLDFKWYIIGEGDQRRDLEMLINKYELQDHFILMGLKTNPYPYFRDCTMYVQPSRYEGYGLTIAEAKAFNRAIVTTNFAGAYDQIKNGVNGLIVSCDADQILEAVTYLLTHKEVRLEFEKNLMTSKVDTSNEIEKLMSIMEENEHE